MKSERRGALIGLAVGDALGAAVEFSSPGSFKPVTGYRAGGPYGLAPGEWTDDTSMALALADSIACAGWDLNDQVKRYIAWWRHGEYSVNGTCFDIGITTRSALVRFLDCGDARRSGDSSERASGNGSIMRLAPVPVRYADYFPSRIEDLADLAEESSLTTHASPQCLSACRYMTLVICGLMHGVDRDEVLSPDWEPLSVLRAAGTLHPAINEVAMGSFRQRKPPQIVGSGYVVKSLEAALWSFHDASDFREAVLRAVNLGDDADTTGAVCGQLAGAYWGEDGVPDDWRRGLARKDMIEKALAGLLAPAVSSPIASGSEESAKSPSVETTVKKQRKKAPSAAKGTSPRPETPPPIHSERFPPKPEFLTSNKAHRKVNEKAVEEALGFALKADLQGLTAMELPPSPKLKSWHGELVAELARQLETRPMQTAAGTYQLADAGTKPPTKSSYWVVPKLLLAGAYPGDPHPDKHRAKLHALLDAGIRKFINLMEENETNYEGEPFVPYDGLAKQLCPGVFCCRHAIRDLSAPTRVAMTTILDTIDESLATGRPTYVHCWGGVGRTGTVIGCWLLRHGLAEPANVLKVLLQLRQQDHERGHRMSPESPEQQRFVKTWLAD
jgi:ADP-ribosyl-[dinitrogen reductase] hydrolase